MTTEILTWVFVGVVSLLVCLGWIFLVICLAIPDSYDYRDL